MGVGYALCWALTVPLSCQFCSKLKVIQYVEYCSNALGLQVTQRLLHGANMFVGTMRQTGVLPLPVVGFIRGLHSSTEVLQVKPHDVIQPINAPQPGVQPIPCHLHLLPEKSDAHVLCKCRQASRLNCTTSTAVHTPPPRPPLSLHPSTMPRCIYAHHDAQHKRYGVCR